jgi:hypothetical protein
MSVTCSHPSSSTDSTTSTPAAPEPSSPSQTAQKAILIADPAGVGYEVELPPSMGDPQAAVDAIYERTPFIPYLKPSGKPTTYDSVEAFLEQHPQGETMRPIIEDYFSYLG